MTRYRLAFRAFIRRHSKNLGPVIVGAMLSAIPVVATVWIQNRQAERVALHERHLEALANWVHSCNAAVELSHMITPR